MGASGWIEGYPAQHDDDYRAMAVKPALRRVIRIARNRLAFFAREIIAWLGVIFVFVGIWLLQA